jgi:hypothetical protein
MDMPKILLVRRAIIELNKLDTFWAHRGHFLLQIAFVFLVRPHMLLLSNEKKENNQTTAEAFPSLQG